MGAPKLAERRVSQRYSLNQDSYCGHVIFEKSIILPMLDISYGGFSVAIDTPDHESLCDTLPRTTEVDIAILGITTTGRAIRVFESKQRLGYAFCHDTASVLIFLRRFIEFMRMGEHLGVIDKNHQKPPYDSGDWLCFRGDGPTELMLRKNSAHPTKVDEAIISFREKDSYRTTEMRGGRIYTVVSSDGRHMGGGATAQDTQANEDIVRKASCVLMGYLQACDTAHKPFIDQTLSALRKQLQSSTQPKMR